MKNLEVFSTDIRKLILEMINKSHASHIACGLSMVDILAVLYGKQMNISPNNVNSDERDRFILSKGHGACAIYATLYLTGFLSTNEIDNYYSNGQYLSGHVSHKNVNGVEFSTGSLGHGACVASGIALSAKLSNKKFYTYVIVGDGECNEGCIWEMAMFSSQQKLDNLIVIVDKNGMQAMGNTSNIINMNNIANKLQDFGFYVEEIDGHDIDSISKAIDNCKEIVGKPKCIIANTVKGKGISFMENNIIWHYRDPQGEYYENAKKELGK